MKFSVAHQFNFIPVMISGLQKIELNDIAQI